MTIFVPSSALNHSAKTTHLQEHRIVRELIDQAALTPETRSKVSQSAKNLVHRIRSSSKPEPIEALNATGYGLTFGLQSRLTVRMQHISEKIKAGNIYINRNQIGAVVGSQPFGGNGLSGTGPKAGGPFYLARFRSLLPPPSGADLVQESALETAALSFLEVHTMNGAALTKAVMAATTPPHSPVEILPGPTGEMNARSTRAKPPILCAGPAFKAAAAQAACSGFRRSRYSRRWHGLSHRHSSPLPSGWSDMVGRSHNSAGL